MATLFDSASLALIPSGVKDGKLYSIKPTDGSGDFTFSRGTDTATRVNSSGLIEKERSNQILQSNQFDTTWTLNTATLTSGQSGYDGSSDAWELDAAAGGSYVQQIVSETNVHTYSAYVKQGTTDYVLFLTGGAGNAFFNLSGSGSVGSTSGLITAKIESVGGGWFRCSITQNASMSYIRMYPSGAGGTQAGSIYIQDAQLEEGLVATAPAIETTTAAVYEGITDNLPRLDYSGGASCPSLLLEPSRTNVNNYSELLTSATGWTATGSVTATTNYGISPEGVQNSTRIVFAGGNMIYRKTISGLTGVEGTFSLYIKGTEGETLNITYGGVDRNITLLSGWNRYSVTATGLINEIFLNTYSGSTARDIEVYGLQVELNSTYPTSYIPCNGTSASRAADSCIKTSATDLIGQTEGTLFVEFKRIPKGENYQAVITLQGASSAQLIEMYFGTTDALLAAVYNSGAQFQASSGGLTEGTYKAALAYKENDFAFYLNGSQIATDSSGTIPALSTINVGGFTYVSGYPQADGIKQTLLFKTRLTNAELAALTTL